DSHNHPCCPTRPAMSAPDGRSHPARPSPPTPLPRRFPPDGGSGTPADDLVLPVCSPNKDQQPNSPLPATSATSHRAGNIDGGRYWDRTSALFGVNEALSR